MTTQQQLIRQIFLSELDYIDSKINLEDLAKEERDERIIAQWALQLDVDFTSNAVKKIRDGILDELITEEENQILRIEQGLIDLKKEDTPEWEETYNNTVKDVDENVANRELRIGILNSIREGTVWQLS